MKFVTLYSVHRVPCMTGKLWSPDTSKALNIQAHSTLDIIKSNSFGILQISYKKGAGCFATFIYNLSHSTVMFVNKNKSKILKILQAYQVIAERQASRKESKYYFLMEGRIY